MNWFGSLFLAKRARGTLSVCSPIEKKPSRGFGTFLARVADIVDFKLRSEEE